MKKIFLALLVGSLISLTGVFYSPCEASDVDVLVNKLIDKGILSAQEGKQLLQEMKEASAPVGVETKTEQPGALESPTLSLPKWVYNTKFKGDMRLRYQYEDKKNDSRPSRERYRFRWRIGVVNKINEQWEAGFGLASGGTDPRSTNQTLEETFQSPDARIDYAYAKYSPAKWINFLGGKFKNPVWKPKDLLWDGDIRTDGFAVPMKFHMAKNELFLVPAYFILDEYKSDSNDPAMWLIQAGGKASLFNNMYVKAAITYYDFSDLKGNSFTHSAGTNTVDSSGNLVEEYDSFAGDVELGMKLGGFVPVVAVFGQFVNSDANKDDTGWLAGLKIGHKKVKQFKQWQLKYNYRDLEKDAWPDFLPDSDFYGGETGVKGHEVEFKFGLVKHVTLGLDYYFNVKPKDQQLDDRKQNLLQIDLVLKW